MPDMHPYPLALVVSTHSSKFAAVSQVGDVAVRIAQLAAVGFDGVELAIRDPALVDGDELAELVERHHLAVPAIGTGQAYIEEGLLLTSADAATRRAALDRVLSHLPLAARMNAAVIVGLIGTASADGQSFERATDHLVAGLRAIAAAADGVGVRVIVEPVNRYESELVRTVDEGLRLLAAVDMDNVGLLLDTFHMNIEEASIPDSIRQCGEKLFHFHTADSNRWYPGAGHIDFSGILDALDELAYGGFLSGEFLPNPGPAEAARMYYENMTTHVRSRA